MKAAIKLYFGTVLQFLVAISLLAVFLYMQEKQDHDSVVINLAGRQRMLSQKITKDILLFSQGVFPVEKVLNTIDVFHQTLKALTYGGKAPLDLVQTTFTTLPAPETKTVVTQLKTVESIWSSFSEIAKRYLNEKKASSLAYLKDNNVLLLQEMNRAVFLMDEEAAGKVASLRKVLLLGSAALSLLFLLTLFTTKRAEAERERLLVTERAQAKRQAALFRLSAELAATLDEEEVSRGVVNGLHDTLGFDLVALFLADEATGDRLLAASAGVDDLPARIPRGQGLSERPLLDGQLHYTPDVTQEHRYIHDLRGSEVDVPILIGEKVQGVLIAENRKPDAFNQNDFEVLTAATQLAGLAIEKARLLASERRRADELEALRTTITDITSELELSNLLHAIVERAAGLLGAMGGELGLYDETSREIQIVVNHNLGQGYIGMRLRLGEGAMGRVAETGEPLIIEDYHTWERRARQYDEIVIHACLAAPLKVGNRLVGVMTIATTDLDRQFDLADVHLINLFAHQAAIAIENARLFAEVQSQKRYSESLVQNSPVAIVTVDKAGDVSSWNPAAERLFGFTRAEALKFNLDVLITTTPEMLEEAKDFTRETKGESRLVHAITRRCRRDGTVVEVEVLAAPIDVKDPYAGSLTIYHDITELKQAQQELQKAKEAAESANRAKSTFLANMSHELRTPLNAIIGFSEMLIEDAEDQGQEGFIPDLQKIHTASKHLLSLINNVLDLSKIEAGKMELYLETFEVMHLIQDVVSTIQPLVEKNANNIKIHSADDLGTMYTDLIKVREGLVNLLGNASKFTEHGTIRLDAARQTFDGADWITFSVSDTGIGMTPEQIKKLFQPFSQAEASMTHKYGGTGLGLEITRRFCEILGGDITVKSVLGVGSTFTIRLPAEIVQPKIELVAVAES
jgi:PAS domain S-box-containing protein